MVAEVAADMPADLTGQLYDVVWVLFWEFQLKFYFSNSSEETINKLSTNPFLLLWIQHGTRCLPQRHEWENSPSCLLLLWEARKKIPYLVLIHIFFPDLSQSLHLPIKGPLDLEEDAFYRCLSRWEHFIWDQIGFNAPRIKIKDQLPEESKPADSSSFTSGFVVNCSLCLGPCFPGHGAMLSWKDWGSCLKFPRTSKIRQVLAQWFKGEDNGNGYYTVKKV